MKRLLAALALLIPLGAAGQYPSKPIRLVAPFAPGGTSEIVARSIAQELTTQLGQTVYVENKGGGAGTIAMSDVAKSPADGHHLIIGHIGSLAVNPFAMAKQPYDVNKDATRQEMRTYVCGQCHVEYYFKGPEKTLTYPWQNGLKIENITSYYDAVGHKDWTHAQSGANVLKAQHPEFEMYNQGIHARAGVACADCHMPYNREGALKISNHHVRSPLLSLNMSCQTCHKATEDELRFRVETIQTRTFGLRNLAMDALVQLIGDIKAARERGFTDEQLSAPRDFQRKAQFYLDFVEAENSMGFHAPGEAARILGESMNFTRMGQVALRDAGFTATSVALAR